MPDFMPRARSSEPALSPGARLDVLAIAPLAYRVGGRGRFQFGGSLYCTALLAGLARLGHRVRALASGPEPGAPEAPEPLAPGVRVDWGALEYRSARAPFPPDYVRRERANVEAALDRAAAERRPDLVLLGSESQAWYAAEPCRERGLPTLLVAHGVPTAALKAGIYPPEAKAALIAHLQQVDRVVAVARHLEAVLRSLGFSRVETISTGVDTRMFRARRKSPAELAKHGIASERFVVGSFSHLRPEKRIIDLVASAELVLAGEPRALYLVAGDGPDRERTVSLVVQKGLTESFRFLGELDHRTVPAHMALCDTVVLASEREGCGVVCLEAQASGRAVIYSDIPAARELVADRETGLLFRMGDAEDLAAKTLELAQDAALRRALARSARAAVLGRTTERWIHAWSEAIVETATAGAAG
jgi:phosphatidylinositol alpha 1,6-mannosyltransferase